MIRPQVRNDSSKLVQLSVMSENYLRRDIMSPTCEELLCEALTLYYAGSMLFADVAIGALTLSVWKSTTTKKSERVQLWDCDSDCGLDGN